MKLEIIEIEKSINRAYFKQNLKYKDIELFKDNFTELLKRIDINESEEHNKNIVSNFLRDTFYKNKYEINTAGRKDLVIHKGKTNKTPVAVVIETKKPSNKSEMISLTNLNTKALHETIHYFLKERIIKNNTEIKHIIISNIYEWFIFDATEFEKYFYQNKEFSDKYIEWNNGNLLGKTTQWFYNEIAKPYVANEIKTIQCNYIDLHKYSSIIKNTDKFENEKLINLYKIFSPEHLLKLPFTNDYNKIDNKFYNELLYILGLQEIKSGGKKLITRATEKNKQQGTILENTINILKTRNKLKNIENLNLFGKNEEEQLFSIALELSITWLNRILFLKLLEGQLIRYNRDDKNYAFLNTKKIKSLEELDELFFEVLAIKPENRTKTVNVNYGNLPYLNSSLFETTELEKQTIQISDLKNRLIIPIFHSTVLKNKIGKKQSDELNTFEYLLNFLNAYNFSSDRKAEIQNDNRTIINAAILGLIFEKINGYKDGSFYTPSFITTYISNETIKKAVVQKFKTEYKNLKSFEELKKRIDYTDAKERKKANEIINSLKICDPAVGSGHFLVSVLNELVAVKSELKILQDKNNNRLKGIHIKNINDELEIIDYETSQDFQYYVNKKGEPHPEIQNIQKTLFYEKQNLIENCIFGVDINQKSVSICRLRLWIELLKSTFYTKDSNYKYLETLPNIDINIKQGNTLINFFDFNQNSIKNGHGQKIQKFTKEYKEQVALYKNITEQKSKDKILEFIENLKTQFIAYAKPNDKEFRKFREKEAELTKQFIFFSQEEKDEWIVKNKKLKSEVAKLKENIEDKKKRVYKNAFEWRFEFPEVLDKNGDFEGFDIVVGNPPYFPISKQQILKEIQHNYKTFKSTGDIYILFIERALQILKKDGLVNFITSNKWMRSAFGENLREYLLKNTNVEQIIDFDGLKVFDEATVDTNIILISKNKTGCKNIETVRFDKTFDLENDSIKKYFIENKKTFDNLTSEGWNLISEKEKLIKNKIEKIGKPIIEWNVNINSGIKTGLNKAFIIDKKTKNKLIKSDKNNFEIIKPLIKGNNIKKHYTNYDNLWLISTFPSKKIDIKNYPKLEKHLKTFGKKLEQTGEEGSRKKTNNKWFELQDTIAYHADFEKEKIMWQAITKKFDFYYDTKGMFSDVTTFIMTGENLKYILSILNSRLFEFCMNEIYLLGDTFRSKNKILQNFPIPEITDENKKTVDKIVKLVNKILSLKEKDNTIDISKEQTKIDNYIYKLYKLNDAEILLIKK